MKNVQKKIASPLLWAAHALVGLCWLLAGCAPPGWGLRSELRLAWPPADGTARTIAPSASWIPVHFEVVLAGPGGEALVMESTDREMTVPDLTLGEWNVQVCGFNDQGQKILEGQSKVSIASPSEELDIALLPLKGRGDLRLRAPKPTDPGAALTGALRPLAGGDALSVAWTAQDGEMVGSLDGIEAGYYKLTMRWESGQEVLASRTEVVLIAAGLETEAFWELGTGDTIGASGGVVLSLSWADQQPPALSLEGWESLAIAGAPARLTVAPGIADPDWRIGWVLDGVEVGEGPEISWPRGLPSRAARLDVWAWNPSLGQGCSTGADVYPKPAKTLLGFGFLRAWDKAATGNRGLSGLRDLEITPSGETMFTASAEASGIGVFSRDPLTGSLTSDFFQETSGMGYLGGVCDLSLSPDGKHLAAAAKKDGALTIFRYAAEESGGEGGPPPAAPAMEAVANSRIPESAGLSAVSFSVDGRFIYGTSGSTGHVLVWSWDPASNSLVLIEAKAPGDFSPGFAEPEALAISSDGRSLAVTAFGSDQLALFAVADDGRLSLSQVFTDGQSGVDGLNGAGRMSFSGDGQDLYVGAYYDNSLLWLKKNGDLWESRKLWKNGVSGIAGLKMVRDLRLAEGDSQLWVASSGDDQVTVFSRNESGDLLISGRFKEGEEEVVALDGVRCLAVSHDGGFLYAGSANSQAVTGWFKMQ